jgi:hypothetical protein
MWLHFRCDWYLARRRDPILVWGCARPSVFVQHVTWRWTRAAIWSGKMEALTRRGLVNAVVIC